MNEMDKEEEQQQNKWASFQIKAKQIKTKNKRDTQCVRENNTSINNKIIKVQQLLNNNKQLVCKSKQYKQKKKKQQQKNINRELSKQNLKESVKKERKKYCE